MIHADRLRPELDNRLPRMEAAVEILADPPQPMELIRMVFRPDPLAPRHATIYNCEAGKEVDQEPRQAAEEGKWAADRRR